ncbi:M20/M25/M40 family metallo-hydrolase [Pseudoclavibacter sp. 13-3]|uniref:M20/M25/M40 family metallo-hydrolase n=1 Tax=Pseudoclavibacter sp. 13-3 TaxID=2901228 RepID=UPI001E5EA2F1|nr:M20/M25/M40 family metallo-hydrolase [Pseudoclavibacter sp. 13-3]MCD7101268.1 M20/M25/M40 family metallo-hydrolase [Pseudoclavibacter sp. 13-3]
MNAVATISEIHERVHNGRERVFERLRHLVTLETPSFAVEASRQIADLLVEWFEAVGGQVERVEAEAGVHLLIEVPGTGRFAPTTADSSPEAAAASAADAAVTEGATSASDSRPLLLIGHSDTVWPFGTLQGDVPWVVDGDIVRGPGVYDMKSGLICMLTALEVLHDREHRPVRIIIVADEEVGSPTSQQLMRRALQGVAGAIGFESPHPDGALKVGRRGSTRVRIAVTGRAAHAALDPKKGISAIDELVDQLVRVRSIVASASERTEVLCNSGTVSGGTRANVVAAHAEAELGLRFIDGESEHTVLDALQQLTPVREGAVVEVEMLSHRPAWLAGDADAALCGRAARAGEAVGLEVTGRPAAGAGDTNLIGSLGVPTIDGFGPLGGGAHAVSEHIVLPTLYQRIELLAALLAK